MNKEGDKSDLEILLEIQQDKFLQILEKRDNEHEKNYKNVFYLCVDSYHSFGNRGVYNKYM